MACNELAQQALEVLRKAGVGSDCLDLSMHLERVMACGFPGEYSCVTDALRARCQIGPEISAEAFLVDHRILSVFACLALGFVGWRLVRAMRLRRSVKALRIQALSLTMGGVALLVWDQVMLASVTRGKVASATTLYFAANSKAPKITELPRNTSVYRVGSVAGGSKADFQLVEVEGVDAPMIAGEKRLSGYVQSSDILWFR